MPAASVSFRTADVEATRGFAWNEVNGDLDLFGDGSMIFLSMPGHTPGNRSVQVRLPNRTVLLTGDTVHLRSAMEGDLPMASDYSTCRACNPFGAFASCSTVSMRSCGSRTIRRTGSSMAHQPVSTSKHPLNRMCPW